MRNHLTLNLRLMSLTLPFKNQKSIKQTKMTKIGDHWLLSEDPDWIPSTHMAADNHL